RIYIRAPYINLNGVIQSGYDDYTLVIGGTTPQGAALVTQAAGLSPNSGTHELTAVEAKRNGFTVSYDTGAERFIVSEIAARGGNVELHGTVLNTGGGAIRLLGGYPDVKIDNRSGKDLVVKGIDLGRQGQGVLLI